MYGTSKAITEYISKGEPYSRVKKIISITIAYFDLGQGKDYVYHGTTQFRGIHNGDILSLAEEQKEIYEVAEAYQVYPEYWIIKVDKFDGVVQDKLDEWIYFLKKSELPENFTAEGLREAKDKLGEVNLTDEEMYAYERYLKRLRDIASEQFTKMVDAQILLNKAMEKGLKQGMEKGMEKKRGKLYWDFTAMGYLYR